MADSKFDASKYLVKLRGKDYLEVKWRLVWLRHDHPDAIIETELVEHELNPRAAVVKARITIPGKGSATGYKRQTASGFGDYIEKAETGAIGRACAALGYGTQNTDDFDMEDEDGAIQVVDSPVERPSPTGGTSAHDDVMAAPNTTPAERTRAPGSTAAAIKAGAANNAVNGRGANPTSESGNAAGTDKPATEAQIRAVYAYGRQWWKLPDGTTSEEHVAEMVGKAAKGKTPEQLTSKEASAIQNMLKDKIKAASQKGAA